MKIFIGADHNGVKLKEAIKKDLEKDGYNVADFSPTKPEGGDDYPDYAFAVGDAVAEDHGSIGVLICDTGVGMAIAANKVEGVNAALVFDVFSARRSREHNNANVVVLGSHYTKEEVAIEIVKNFIETSFTEAERHTRRISKIKFREKYGKA